jgi:hypothetical protein
MNWNTRSSKKFIKFIWILIIRYNEHFGIHIMWIYTDIKWIILIDLQVIFNIKKNTIYWSITSINIPVSIRIICIQKNFLSPQTKNMPKFSHIAVCNDKIFEESRSIYLCASHTYSDNYALYHMLFSF